jgi:hypothetical protein
MSETEPFCAFVPTIRSCSIVPSAMNRRNHLDLLLGFPNQEVNNRRLIFILHYHFCMRDQCQCG